MFNFADSNFIISAALSMCCYVAAEKYQQRQLILNGHNVLKGRFPSFVSLDYHHNGVVLAGVLIAPDVVLTAGHAKPSDDNEIVTARIGTYSLTHDINPEEYDIVQAVRHPAWVEFPDGFSHDFCLFKLNGTASSRTPLATLNRNPKIPDAMGEVLQVLGLGWTNMTLVPSPADIVQMAELDYLPNSDCRTLIDPLRSINFGAFIDDTMLCARGGPNNERDACGWDSGGPVLITGNDYKSDVVVGLVSWGIGCADPVFPSVYARISAGIDWIDAMVCRLSDNPPAVFNCTEKPSRRLHSFSLVPLVAIVFGCGLWVGRQTTKMPYNNENEELASLADYGSIESS